MRRPCAIILALSQSRNCTFFVHHFDEVTHDLADPQPVSMCAFGHERPNGPVDARLLLSRWRRCRVSFAATRRAITDQSAPQQKIVEYRAAPNDHALLPYCCTAWPARRRECALSVWLAKHHRPLSEIGQVSNDTSHRAETRAQTLATLSKTTTCDRDHRGARLPHIWSAASDGGRTNADDNIPAGPSQRSSPDACEFSCRRLSRNPYGMGLLRIQHAGDSVINSTQRSGPIGSRSLHSASAAVVVAGRVNRAIRTGRGACVGSRAVRPPPLRWQSDTNRSVAGNRGAKYCRSL